MKSLYLDELVQATGGALTRCEGHVGSITGVSTDSRRVNRGDVFFPLVGESLDGHRYIAQALASGAAGVVAMRGRAGEAASKAPFVIEVDDTTLALGRLASALRQWLPMRVIAVTGSNGKTTTKAMIHHLLRASGCPTVAAPKSFNNRIGVPLTLLQADVKTQFVVVEMGTNAPGEIAELAAIARPDVAAVTNIGPSHLEKLGSLDGVMNEKGAIFDTMSGDGIGALNFDDPRGRRLAEGVPGWFVTYGTSKDADVRAVDIARLPDVGFSIQLADGTSFDLPVAGRHNVMNALAALACCVALDREPSRMAPAFGSFLPPEMRMNVLTLPDGVTIIDDAYNANPQSLSAAMDELRDRPCRGRRICIVGDMLELGADAASWHDKAGQRAAAEGFDIVIGVGELARHLVEGARAAGMPADRAPHYDDSEKMVAAVADWVQPDDTVLVKGSRRMGLEAVVRAIGSLRTASV